MPRKSDSTTFDPPIQGWRIEGYYRRIENIQPVLIHKETAFRFKIQKYYRSYHPRQPRFTLGRTCTYYDKHDTYLTYEDAVRRIIELRESDLRLAHERIEHLKQDLNKSRAALLTPEPFPDPSIPVFTPPEVGVRTTLSDPSEEALAPA